MTPTKIIAHRGARNETPENTLAAIKRALDLRVLGVEFDVELCRDGLVVVHQETMAPNESWTRLELANRHEGRNWVNTSSLSEIRKLDAGSWFSPDYSHEKIPTLKEILTLDWGPALKLLEIKDPFYEVKRDTGYEVSIVEKIVKIIQGDLGFRNNLIFLSFNEHILELCIKSLPEVPTLWNLWLPWEGKAAEAIIRAGKVGCKTLGIPERFVQADPNWVTLAKEKQLQIFTYPVSPARNELDLVTYTYQASAAILPILEESGVAMIGSDFSAQHMALLEPSRKID